MITAFLHPRRQRLSGRIADGQNLFRHQLCGEKTAYGTLVNEQVQNARSGSMRELADRGIAASYIGGRPTVSVQPILRRST